MKVLIFPQPEAAVRRTADLLMDQVRRAPRSVLGLATGGTMEPVYAEILARRDRPSFAGVQSFNLDEYVGLAPEHPQSYHRYMAQHLFDGLDMPATQAHLPRGDAPLAHLEASEYDARIRAAGRIDLQLLGLGANGHIGFNEPGSSLGSRTRVKTLTRKTLEDNARFFGPDEEVPRYAITMGIETIMEARQIVLLALGPGKAAAVRGMIEGAVSTYCPASILQFHKNATIVIDEAAAADLTLRDYFEEVHPGGAEVLV